MSKYSSGLSTQEICKLECAEARDILAKYCVSPEDADIIIGMIKQAYFLLGKANVVCDYLEKALDQISGGDD